MSLGIITYNSLKWNNVKYAKIYVRFEGEITLSNLNSFE